MKIDVVLRVFPALETTEVLPVGTQRVFLSTIWELKDTVDRVDREHIEGVLDDDARMRLTVAEHILHDVSERAPKLLALAEQAARADWSGLDRKRVVEWKRVSIGVIPGGRSDNINTQILKQKR